MYIPSPFAEHGPAVLRRFIAEHNFGVMVSAGAAGLSATHLPFTIQDAPGGLRLVGHLARANPHWRALDGAEVLVVFSGPHAYVSPGWYERADVPTWNYAAVHAHGTARVITSETRLREALTALVDQHERGGIGAATVTTFSSALPAIVGCEIEVTRLEGKFKLSQNRSLRDQRRVAAALKSSPRLSDSACGAFMEERLEGVEDD